MRTFVNSSHSSPHVEWSHDTALSHILASEEDVWSDEDALFHEGVTPEDLREMARHVHRKKDEAVEWANLAQRRGHHHAVAGYKRDIQEYTDEIEHLNRSAADAIFTRNNEVYHSPYHIQDEVPRVRHAKNCFV